MVHCHVCESRWAKISISPLYSDFYTLQSIVVINHHVYMVHCHVCESRWAKISVSPLYWLLYFTVHCCHQSPCCAITHTITYATNHHHHSVALIMLILLIFISHDFLVSFGHWGWASGLSGGVAHPLVPQHAPDQSYHLIYYYYLFSIPWWCLDPSSWWMLTTLLAPRAIFRTEPAQSGVDWVWKLKGALDQGAVSGIVDDIWYHDLKARAGLPK